MIEQRQQGYGGTGTFSSNSYSGEGGSPQRIASVPVAVGELQKCVEAFAATMAQHAARLESAGVLRPTPPQAADRGTNARPSRMCTLADAVATEADRITGLASALAELNDRLEV